MDIPREEDAEGGSIVNDGDIEQQLHDAFDSIKVPEDVKAATLSHIEAVRKEGSASTDAKKPRRVRRIWVLVGSVGSIAACLVIALSLFGILGSNSSSEESSTQAFDLDPTAFVDIDINPSVQLELNREDQVIGAHGLNEDGDALLAAAPIDGMFYEQALRALMGSDAASGFLGEDPFIELSISSDDQRQERTLKDMSERYLASIPYDGACRGVSSDIYEEAHSHGMGCGRYSVALELMELDPTLSLEECSDMSMRELRDRIDALESLDGDRASDSDDASISNGAGRGGSGQEGMGAHHGGHGAHHGWS